MTGKPSSPHPAVRVPFLDLAALHRPLEEQLVAALREGLRTSRFVGGPPVEQFEREFASFCKAPWCIGVNSGTDALRFAYQALGVRPGGEIITTAHTFIATTECMPQVGAVPRFVDIDEDTMTMDPALVEAAVSPKTVGLVPVHLYGQPADMDPLLALAKKHSLWLVEDAAQAHGATYGGRTIGSLGDLACFSFYPGKNLGSLGEGGAVTGTSTESAVLIRQLREHGQSSKYVHEIEGYNGRLHALQAAFLSVKLAHLARWNTQRQEVAGWYHEALADVSDIRLPATRAGSSHVFHLYVIRGPRRDKLRDALQRAGIETGLHYPVPLHRQQAYAHLGYKEGSLPVTERVAASLLSLPIFPGMSKDQVLIVADAVRSFYGS